MLADSGIPEATTEVKNIGKKQNIKFEANVIAKTAVFIVFRIENIKNDDTKHEIIDLSIPSISIFL
ncbi:MAG: hypothetical protein FWC41_05580 [Firmicutes bacterium]|nr:hypothetical protein [Bacillota bacterium]